MTPIEIIAEVLRDHTEGYLFQGRDTATTQRIDTGGLRCMARGCTWARLPEQEGTVYRPYTAFRIHVAETIWKALSEAHSAPYEYAVATKYSKLGYTVPDEDEEIMRRNVEGHKKWDPDAHLIRRRTKGPWERVDV